MKNGRNSCDCGFRGADCPLSCHFLGHWLRFAGCAVLLYGVLAFPVAAECHCWVGYVSYNWTNHYTETYQGSVVMRDSEIITVQKPINQDGQTNDTRNYYNLASYGFNEVTATCDAVTYEDGQVTNITGTGTFFLFSKERDINDTSLEGRQRWSPNGDHFYGSMFVSVSLVVTSFHTCNGELEDYTQDVNVVQSVPLSVDVRNFSSLTGETAVFTDYADDWKYSTYSNSMACMFGESEISKDWFYFAESRLVQEFGRVNVETPTVSDRINGWVFAKGGDVIKDKNSQNYAVDKLVAHSVNLESYMAWDFQGGDNADIPLPSVIHSIPWWPDNIIAIPMEWLREPLQSVRDAMRVIFRLLVWMYIIFIVFDNLVGVRITWGK